MSGKNKKIKEQELRETQQREEILNNALKFSRKRFKKFDEVILQLYVNKDLSSFFTDQRIAKVHECFTKFSSKSRLVERALLKNVFVHIHKHSVLLSEADYIQVVFNAFQFRAYWRKDIYEWKPSTNRSPAQVNELVSYLFCQYKVPGFLYKAFAETTNMLFINWFIHIGTGRKVKELINVPISFTQKMGHYFLQAPDKFTVPEALRWAQVRGLNGDEKLAERIAYSWIGTKAYGDEDFWETFIRIIIGGGMFDYDRLTGIIDYVRDTKRENRSYSLKGRTLPSLIRQSDEWHRNAAFTRGNQYWNPSGLYGYKVEKKLEVIKLEELTGSKLLADEGRAMKHCVATYAYQCNTGKTAIFSLRKYSLDILIETLATIEVNLPLRRVVQAKARMNKKISDEARKHLEEWAGKNELSIGSYL